MELSDILTLVKAGYTRQEIELMEKPVNASPVIEPVPAAEPEPQPEPVPAAAPAAVPAAVPAQQDSQPSINDLMQSIAKLTSAIQSNAIAQSIIPGGAANAPKAEDMLAEIIRPTYKERNNE